MIEKKIKKFYNSVPVRDRMPVSEDGINPPLFPFVWIAMGLLIGAIAIVSIGMMMKDDAGACESD
ncbi:MAG: hypothetical protein IJA86_08090 [Clostridia bacterium]|nr:hypothetical protein [Clostridia bacterium]